jgi:hypothetical protein
MKDPQDLKIAAFAESIGTMASMYENKIADLRVQVTLQGEELEEKKKAIEALQEALRVSQEARTTTTEP